MIFIFAFNANAIDYDADLKKTSLINLAIQNVFLERGKHEVIENNIMLDTNDVYVLHNYTVNPYSYNNLLKEGIDINS